MKRSELKRTTPMKRTASPRCAITPNVAKLAVKIKPRKCAVKGCANRFEKRSMTHRACSPKCAEVLVELDREKKERRAAKIERAETKVRIEALRPLKWWRAKAKTALHAYIRTRDEGKTCISCDTILVKIGRVGGDYDAGHFRSVGGAKHLEFVENNIHGQCKRCNDYLKGNQIEYEHGLVRRFNRAYVEALKNDNVPRHLKIEDFQAIEATYKRKLKELKAREAIA